jgi:hypothetical protein
MWEWKAVLLLGSNLEDRADDWSVQTEDWGV